MVEHTADFAGALQTQSRFPATISQRSALFHMVRCGNDACLVARLLLDKPCRSVKISTIHHLSVRAIEANMMVK